MVSLDSLKKRKREILRRIELTEARKKEVLKRGLDKETTEKWLEYYNNYIKVYKKHLEVCENEIKKQKPYQQKVVYILIFSILIVLILIFISIFPVFKPLGLKAGEIGEKISVSLEKIITPEFKEKVPEIVEPEVEIEKEAEKFEEPEVPVVEKEFEEPEVPVVLEDKKVSIKEESLLQYRAVVGKHVKWKKQFTIETVTGFSVEIPKNSENVKIKKIENGKEEDITEIVNINEKREYWLFGEKRVEIGLTGKSITGKAIADNSDSNLNSPSDSISYEVEYETPPPEISELEIEGRAIKKVLIKGPDDVHYKNILSFTELPREFRKDEIGKLKLYEIRNGQRIATEFIAYDTNENSLLDYIEWLTPYLSEAVYELVIEISKAEHLDENKNFISDIYNEVKELDGNWSEEIKSGEYVRVTFRQKLDNTRDITIYPRIAEGNPRIEVYEVDGDKVIAEFVNISSNEYNKVYLTNLQGQQDVFDLRVLGGSVEIEHIIDPFVSDICGIINFEEAGTSVYPKKINTCCELQAVKYYLSEYFVLDNDIDCSDTASWNWYPDNGGYLGFEPIGTNTAPFTGTFDGQNYVINGLYINRATYDFMRIPIGLFGYTSATAEIKNVGLENVDISAYGYAGALVGQNYGKIDNSYSNGTVKSFGSSGTYLSDNTGGLVGYNWGTISNSYSTADVESSASNVGGLIGGNFGGNISTSYSTGNIDGWSQVGGFVGLNSLSGNINKSYSTGSVTGRSLSLEEDTEVGGFVGRSLGGTISNSYSTGNVTGSSYVGGFIGVGGIIINSYSTGKVNCDSSSCKGFSAFGEGCTNCFWDTQTSGKDTSSCGATGKTTAEMKTKNTFINAGWDFVNIWGIKESVSYPLLKVFDKEAPSVNVVSPLAQFYNTQNIEFRVTATDDTYVDWCKYFLDGGIGVVMDESGSDFFNTSSVSEGGHTVYFSCRDIFGNENKEKSVSFSVDVTAPAFSNYKRNPDPPNEDQNVEVRATVTDINLDKVFLEWNGAATYEVTTYSGNEYYFTVDKGMYTAHDFVTYYWRAIDSVGNEGTSTQQSFTVANRKPSVSAPAINPGSPRTNEIISCDGGSFSDVDNEDTEQGRQFKWYDSGVEISGQTSKTLDLSISGLNKGDAIKCSIRVSDGYDWSDWADSPSVIIQNTPPPAPTSLSLTSPVYIGSTLTATASGPPDADGDTITYYYEFYNVNDAAMRQDYSTDNTYVIQQLDAHDKIRVRARAYDGTDYSGYYENSVTVSSLPPEILDIEPPVSPLLTEDDGTGTMTTGVSFSFIAYDKDGVSDLPSSGIIASGYFGNTDNTPYHYNTQRSFTGGNCFVAGDFVDSGTYGHVGETLRRYTCSVNMYYYDDPEQWNVYITEFKDLFGSDASNLPYHLTGDYFIPPETSGVTISETLLSFGIISYAMTQGVPSTKPMTLINTGNVYFNALTDSKKIYFRGRDLKRHGGTEFIFAENFIASLDEPQPADCKNALTKITLLDRLDDADGVAFTNLILPNGALSLGHGKKTVYFCMISINSGLPAGDYSTTSQGTNNPWIVSPGPVALILFLIKFIKFNLEVVILFAVAVVIRKRKKEKRKNALEVFDKKLKNKYIDFAGLLDLDESLREKYALGIEEILAIAKKEKVEEKIREEIQVPIFIFKQEISPTEALCKYLKENLGLRFSEIAKILNRDERTVWINYRNAVKKKKEKIKTEKKVLISVSVELFSDRRLSVLESIVKYLKEKGLRNYEIAKLLGKDQRNIYTLYSRVKKKLG